MIFNKKEYPDFSEFCVDRITNMKWLEVFKNNLTHEETTVLLHELYTEWLYFIGGKQNEFLREFLRDFRLA